MPLEGQYPLGQIRRGLWNKVPVIIGGQNCESCNLAETYFGAYTRDGVSRTQFRAALRDAGFSRVNGSAVGPDALEESLALTLMRVVTLTCP